MFCLYRYQHVDYVLDTDREEACFPIFLVFSLNPSCLPFFFRFLACSVQGNSSFIVASMFSSEANLLLSFLIECIFFLAHGYLLTVASSPWMFQGISVSQLLSFSRLVLIVSSPYPLPSLGCIVCLRQP